jgi:hypothetical protein
MTSDILIISFGRNLMSMFYALTLVLVYCLAVTLFVTAFCMRWEPAEFVPALPSASSSDAEELGVVIYDGP